MGFPPLVLFVELIKEKKQIDACRPVRIIINKGPALKLNALIVQSTQVFGPFNGK
jgi:hypothetical protein